MRLFDALELAPGELVCFVGAGGKTSLMLRLASECAARGLRVLVTTSTRMFDWQLQEVGKPVLEPDAGRLAARLEEALASGLLVAAAAGLLPDAGKVAGLSREALDAVHRTGLFDCILVEADGARGRALKAPALHEPVVPARATCIVDVVGADALGCSLTGEHVHRHQLAARLAGQAAGSTITASTILCLVRYYRGLVGANCPGGRFIPAINKADSAELLGKAREIATCLLPSVGRVLITSANRGQPVLDVLS